MAEADEFATWLNQRLAERGISHRQLAHRAGLDHTTVSRLARGTRAPSHRTARRLADVLDDRSGPERVTAILRSDPWLRDSDVERIVSVYIGILNARKGTDRTAIAVREPSNRPRASSSTASLASSDVAEAR